MWSGIKKARAKNYHLILFYFYYCFSSHFIIIFFLFLPVCVLFYLRAHNVHPLPWDLNKYVNLNWQFTVIRIHLLVRHHHRSRQYFPCRMIRVNQIRSHAVKSNRRSPCFNPTRQIEIPSMQKTQKFMNGKRKIFMWFIWILNLPKSIRTVLNYSTG